MFGGGGAKPPPPPPPPANPPTYASQALAAPTRQNFGAYGPLGSTILTGPMGAPESGATSRKSLLGQ